MHFEMLGYNSWKIRYKLILPLFAVAMLGSAVIASAVVGTYRFIASDVLPQERRLNDIRGYSLELLNEYREFMLVPDDSVRREIDEVKENILTSVTAFKQLARANHNESGIDSLIQATVRDLSLRGDEAVALRRRSLVHIASMEILEKAAENLFNRVPVIFDTNDGEGAERGAGSGEVFDLEISVQKYLSELREYKLSPNEETRQEIAEIERTIERIFLDRDGIGASGPGNFAEDSPERATIQQLLEAGRVSLTFTADYQAKQALLEQVEGDLLDVLAAARSSITRTTDEAFITVIAVVAAAIVAVLATIVLVGYLVSRDIGGAVAEVARTADRLGAGDLSARASVRTKDETANLAAAFNLMADSVESNVARRERAESTMKVLNENLKMSRDQAEAANRSKSEFLATMSHELRTPLNAIIGFSDVMRSEPFGPIGRPEYREYLEDIRSAGQHLLALINDILDLSKLEAGLVELREENIEISNLMEMVLRLVSQRAENGRLALELDLSAGLPLLRADARKLTQILVNLLSNSVKFTDPGGKVTLKVRCQPGDGHVFQVIDTGIGIAPEDIPTAFSRFSQIDCDLNRQYDGTGLGLPLTKALVELHGGSLDLQSQPGVGTTVTVGFPAERVVRVPGDTEPLSATGQIAS